MRRKRSRCRIRARGKGGESREGAALAARHDQPTGAAQERLARIYEAFNGEAADTRFYLRLAGTDGLPLAVLDAGCGTGLLATALAAAGHAVTGADISPAVLAFARQRAGGDRVQWIEANLRRLALEARFDLVLMTGHAVQAFLTQAALAAVMLRLKDHLKPGGRLAFETRNPRARSHERWTPARSRRCRIVPGLGAVEAAHRVTRVAAGGAEVAFETRYRCLRDGVEIVMPSRLGFPSQSAIARALEAAGFSKTIWYGDFHGAPLGEDSPEIIVVAT